jgi:hypothetical protein
MEVFKYKDMTSLGVITSECKDKTETDRIMGEIDEVVGKSI